MATSADSGRYAIAGFLYQLVGSGIEALEQIDGPQDDVDSSEILLVECLGQDAAILPSDGSHKKPRLIQYKYSSTGSEIKPSTLREILQSFLKSVRKLGLDTAEIEYKLVTNRQHSSSAKEWNAASVKALEELVRKTSDSPIDDCRELASIFRCLEFQSCSLGEFLDVLFQAGHSFGMLDDEILPGAVDRLAGMLFRKASESGRRIVRCAEIDNALTGYDAPFRLLSKPSVQLRRDGIERFRNESTNGRPTIARTVSAEIARSILEYPVTVVVGDGGTGKTVATCEAVASVGHNQDSPPGFGIILRASELRADAINGEIDRWRNHVPQGGTRDWERSLCRLRGAFAANPLLVICIDAIDEKPAGVRLSAESLQCIRELMDYARAKHDCDGRPIVSIVLTCRRAEELDNLTSSGFAFEQQVNPIGVGDFDDSEMTRLVADLDFSVWERISGHLAIPDLVIDRSGSRNYRSVNKVSSALIRYPLMWRFFSCLNAPAQHACLDGSLEGLGQLAKRYLDWFCRKAEGRIAGLHKAECITVLGAAAHRFDDDSARTGELKGDWLVPCGHAGCRELQARQVYEEAMTAGMLIEDEKHNRRWRWRHPWVCEYLCRTEAMHYE